MGKIQKKKRLLTVADNCKEVEIYSPLDGGEFTNWENIMPLDFTVDELPKTFSGAYRVESDILQICWEIDKIEVSDDRGGKRPGSGRKTQYPGRDKTKITLSLLNQAIDLLNEEEERTNISRSDIINSLILQNLKHVDYEIELQKLGWTTEVTIDDHKTLFIASRASEKVTIEKDSCYCAASEEDVCNKVWKDIYEKAISVEKSEK